MSDEQAPREPLSPQWVHVIRTCQAIHMQLSQMADQKASILMGASFVIFTLAIGQSHGGVPPLPLAILALFAFVSAGLAMSVAMPTIGGGKGAPPPNLLFFGSFTDLSESEFVDRLRTAVTQDHGSLEIMARDLYQNGQVLRRKKYRLLGWAYRVMLAGLVASFAAFVWEAALAWLP